MKRLLCLLLSLLLAVSFAACKAEKKNSSGNGGVTVQSDTDKDEKDVKSDNGGDSSKDIKISIIADRETFTLGKIENNDYFNESAGFKITGLSDKWVQSTPQQLAVMFDGGVDPSTGKAYSSDSEDGSQNYLYDILYTNSETDEVISVSLLEHSGEEGLSDEMPGDESSNEIDGFTDSEELTYLTVAGRKLSCKKIRYKMKENKVLNMPELTEYEIYMMSSSFNQVIKIVIVCFDGQTDVESILSHFSKI